MTLNELAMAYELRQEGCCWKRIADGLGGDARLISAQVSHLVLNGIRKGLDGYARKPGKPAGFPLEIIIAAHEMRIRGSSWKGVARELDLDHEPLRMAHRYAITHGLISSEQLRNN